MRTPGQARRGAVPARGRAGALLLSLSLAAAVGCGRPERVERFAGETMGTTYAITVVRQEAEPWPAGRRAAVAAAIAQRLEEVDAAMSTYRPDSELSRFNRHAGPEPFAVSPGTAAVIATALRIARETGGALDPTVAPLVDAWGFGPAASEAAPSGPERLGALRARVGYQRLELDAEAGTLRKAHPDLALDLSAVAKGYAVDRVADALAGLGLQDFMVEIGGEVRTAGGNAAGAPWRIGIERPDAAGRAVARIVPLAGEALATSGDYRNFREIDGVRRGHIIDPRTGYPVERGLASVSVVHARCADADGYATALMVLGPAAGLAFATERGLAALFLVRTAAGGLEERRTPAFEARAGVAQERPPAGGAAVAPLLAAVLLTALAMTGLGAGLLLRGRCLRRGCAGAGAAAAGTDGGETCSSCGRTRRGLGLLELVLALAIAGLMAAALLGNHRMSLRLRQQAARRERALELADRVLGDLLLTQAVPDAGERSGPFPDEASGLEWWVEGEAAPAGVPGAVLVRVEVRERGGASALQELVTVAVPGTGKVPGAEPAD